MREKALTCHDGKVKYLQDVAHIELVRLQRWHIGAIEQRAAASVHVLDVERAGLVDHLHVLRRDKRASVHDAAFGVAADGELRILGEDQFLVALHAIGDGAHMDDRTPVDPRPHYVDHRGLGSTKCNGRQLFVGGVHEVIRTLRLENRLGFSRYRNGVVSVHRVGKANPHHGLGSAVHGKAPVGVTHPQRDEQRLQHVVPPRQFKGASSICLHG